jgi:nitrate/TMAO reductase-like tetraheme cytochrome c subunit
MKLPETYRNPISILGTIIAAIAFTTIVLLMVMTYFLKVGSVYFDLFTFIVVPIFLFGGLAMISVGMLLTWRRRKKGPKKFPEINLNDKKQRNAASIFIIVTVIFIIMTVLGTNEGIKYSESREFCGTMCHKAMNPEYVAYHNGPHAEVTCTDCHVGEGVDYFIKAKISGIRQMYKYITGSYNRPINTPITSLRPASQTCEKCHWPQKFYTYLLRSERYFLTDSANTEWDVVLKMKVGPDNPALGLAEGIHWHINSDVKIEYKANEKRDTIYWVKVINTKTGKETIFNNDAYALGKDSIANIATRTMDCMDCHNRPAHEYHSPSQYVNSLLISKKVPASIPWIKKIAMEALCSKEYTTTDSAKEGIRSQIIGVYEKKFPKIYQKYHKEINEAIPFILDEYTHNVFPEMKINYTTYPRHIGHFETNGCFRCHNNNFKSEDGKVISKNCNLCHTILAQGAKDTLKSSTINKPLEFVHPVNIGDVWKESECRDCHFEMFKVR